MQSLTISSSNEVRLLINDDPNRVVAFDPSDLEFIDNFYDLITDYEKKLDEFKKRDRVISANKDIDKYGRPKNTKARIKLNRDFCVFVKEHIDLIFGEGTSEAAFGGRNNIEMIAQFFEGIAPFIENKRKEKAKKYVFTPAEETEGGVME